MKNSKGVAILGATGSIGRNCCRVLETLPEEFHTTGVVARNSLEALAQTADKLHAPLAITTDDARGSELQNLLPPHCRAQAGESAVIDLVTAPETDIVLCAIVGVGGLAPVLAALRAGKRVALASKEVLVLAGDLVRRALRENPQSELVPVDSEHSAIFQCLEGRAPGEVRNVVLTASGGAFRDWPLDRIAHATLNDALNHPVWSMGVKVTVDSASMMNKALELVEARHLFDMPPERLKVLIHPQGVVHGMVELNDGGVIAQLSCPDMRFAISYALSYPRRIDAGLPALSLPRLGALEFREPDPARYPALRLAYEALRYGGTMTGVMNAANEVAVDKFVRGEIAFGSIRSVVERTMASHTPVAQSDLDAVLEADAWARNFATGLGCD